MGLLNEFLSAVDSKKNALKRSLLDAWENPNQWGQMQAARIEEDRYGSPEGRAAVKASLSGKPYDKQALALADAAQQKQMQDQAMGAITVWHGSPHKFDKFDMSKIGTGEGAQAYGHGLYMAESPEVANGYRSNLTYKAGEIPKIGGLEVLDYYGKLSDKANRLPQKLAANEYDKLAMLEDLMGEQATPQMVLAGAADRGYPKHAVDWFNKEVVPKYEMPGAMYKTDIPDEAVARFLDWDKPLSQQAHVASASGVIGQTIEGNKARMKELLAQGGKNPTAEQIAEYNDLARKNAFIRGDATNGTGEGLYNNLVRQFGSQDAATKYLQEQGIPGIRYLDGGSRGTGAGTSNFVLFDDQMPRILEINGQPTGLKPWAAGEWKGLLGNN